MQARIQADIDTLYTATEIAKYAVQLADALIKELKGG